MASVARPSKLRGARTIRGRIDPHEKALDLGIVDAAVGKCGLAHEMHPFLCEVALEHVDSECGERAGAEEICAESSSHEAQYPYKRDIR